MTVEFIVVNVPSPYNAILDRNWMHDLKAIASPYHQVVCYIGGDGDRKSFMDIR